MHLQPTDHTSTELPDSTIRSATMDTQPTRLLKYRLSQEDIGSIISAFQPGTTQQTLGTTYGISLFIVKKNPRPSAASSPPTGSFC